MCVLLSLYKQERNKQERNMTKSYLVLSFHQIPQFAVECFYCVFQVCEAVMYLRRLSSKHNISVLDYSINTDSQDELSDVSSRPLTLQICHSFLFFLLLFPVAFDLQRSILRWVSNHDYLFGSPRRAAYCIPHDPPPQLFL